MKVLRLWGRVERDNRQAQIIVLGGWCSILGQRREILEVNLH
jgi:hypothetical protein